MEVKIYLLMFREIVGYYGIGEGLLGKLQKENNANNMSTFVPIASHLWVGSTFPAYIHRL
ncbi:hypothetical protein Lal_00019010 [Lupinus albus]|nr:hypothetical protein Lal_00019010 [Lupinus albus]